MSPDDPVWPELDLDDPDDLDEILELVGPTIRTREQLAKVCDFYGLDPDVVLARAAELARAETAPPPSRGEDD